jgi:hypothetical protein
VKDRGEHPGENTAWPSSGGCSGKSAALACNAAASLAATMCVFLTTVDMEVLTHSSS